ncbi:MAG: hypothetical protein M1820_009485 [Bogoriella megaspora]|nr:MAG: hypothetical protein M1820_009485 [Bogoriella megaspora]
MKTYASLLALASILSPISAQVTGKLGDATVVTSNPAGAQYLATFPNSLINVIRGRIVASSPFGGSGINFAVNIANLPLGQGPFSYHIHEFPVPANGDCTGTGAHLDPFQRGDQPLCDASRPQSCQVGDLTGKYGKINGTAQATAFTDPFTSLTPGTAAFIGNRSITVHNSNGTRIACASFVPYLTGSNSTGSGSGSGSGSSGSPPFGSNSTGSGGHGATNVPPRPGAAPTASPAPASSNDGGRTGVTAISVLGIAIVMAVML